MAKIKNKEVPPNKAIHDNKVHLDGIRNIIDEKINYIKKLIKYKKDNDI